MVDTWPVANPREEAARSMLGAGITSLGSRIPRRFEPQAISESWANEPENYSTNFPTREQADRFDYGHAQMWNPQGGARDVGPWMHPDSGMINPNVFERQMGLGSFPGAAKKYAQLSNQGFSSPMHFNSPAQLRNLLGYANAMNADPSLQNSMYADLYGPDDDDPPVYSPEMYESKREQVEDEENTFVSNLMDMYGRDNPLLQELGGTETTDVTSPRGDVTTEQYLDEGYNLRDLSDIQSGYGSNLDWTSPLEDNRLAGMDDSLQSLLQQIGEYDPNNPDHQDIIELLQSDIDMNYPWAT